MKWNSLNVISENASTVGSFDLGLYKTKGWIKRYFR